MIDIPPANVTATPGLRASEAIDQFMAQWKGEVAAERQRVNSSSPNAERLLKYMARFYSDWHIKHELDGVLSACDTDGDRDVVQRYARLRRRAKDYDPRSPEDGRRHNSHTRSMIDQALDVARDTRPVCAVCNERFDGRRNATTCPDRVCKAAARRRRHQAHPGKS